jgi:Terminase RNaseH-like domain
LNRPEVRNHAAMGLGGRSSPALRGYQARVLRSLLRGLSERGATFTVMFPRQSGKNEVSAALVAATLLGNASAGGTVVVCAPTLHPQAVISLERTRRALERVARLLPDGVRIESRESSIRVGRASAVFLSASPEANVAGHTASLLLVADEAQDIEADWFDRQFRPMAASTGAPVVLFGTAWDGHTLLEREAARNRAFDARRRVASNEEFIPRHHQVSWEEVAAGVPAYGEYVRGERDRLGPSHPLFLTQYELTPARDVGSLLSEAQIEALRGMHATLGCPSPGERYAAGLDFAGESAGADRTVLTIARVVEGRCEVVALRSWQSAPFGQMTDEAAAEVRRWRVERVCTDATGMGAPLSARLAADLGPRLERVTFTAAAKSAMGYEMLAAANTGRLALFADDGSAEFARCLRELRACRSAPAAGQSLRWFAPPGEHDDYVVSLALCLRAASGVRPPRVAIGRRAV